MNCVTLNYHATFDKQFEPKVTFVPAESYSAEYYRVHFTSGVMAFFTRDQLCQIMAAIASGIQPAAEQMPLTSTEPVESDESYEAREALQKYDAQWAEIPVLQRCNAEVLPLTAPEFTQEVQA